MIKGKEKIGRKITRIIEENVPGLKDMNFQNERVHWALRIIDDEIPAPGYIIMKLQTTRERENILKLPVREKRKTKPTKQGFVEKVWTTTPPGHLQTPGSTTRASKLWGKIISNLGLDYTSKQSNKFVGKIKSFRYFLGCKMWAKKWDGMGASPGGE